MKLTPCCKVLCKRSICLKAVCSFGYEAVSYADFEIYHARNGAPEVRILNPMLEEKVELKIFHYRTVKQMPYAIAWRIKTLRNII